MDPLFAALLLLALAVLASVSSILRRAALPLAAALLLLGSAACDDPRSTGSSLPDTSVDSSDSRAHRMASLVARTDTLSVLTQALRQTGLLRELRRDGPYTLFAPTDQAFERHLPGLDSLLLAPAGNTGNAARERTARGRAAAPSPPDRRTDSLRHLLEFHLVRGRFGARNVKDSLRLGTILPGKSLVLQCGPRQTNQPRGEQRQRGQRTAGQSPCERLRVRIRGMARPVPVRRTLEAQNGVLHVLNRPLRIPAPDTSSGGALGDTTGTAPAN